MRILFRALIAICFCSSVARAGLTSDNLLLIVNKNVPDSQKLAEHYAEQRHVPDGRILALDLPTGDEISVDAFDEQMVAPIRKFITDHHLETQITCIVNFYGVPLRIPSRKSDAALRAELVSLRKQISLAAPEAQADVESLEKVAAQVDGSFRPPPLNGLDLPDALLKRAEFAATFAVQHLQKMPAGPNRDALQAQFDSIVKKLRGPVDIVETIISTTTTSQPAMLNASLSLAEVKSKMAELSLRRWDADDRHAFRDLVRDRGGILLFNQLLSAQEQYLNPEDDEAAVDNELPLLWWGLYNRARWQVNPLNYKYAAQYGKPVVMVMRLDAGKPEQVKAMIDTSIKVEHDGLKGRVVLDSRGILAQGLDGKTNPFGIYDQTIRNLEVLLHSRSKLPMLVDDRPQLIPPNTVKDCAVYCGWYSPGKYVPSVSFVPGGVAFHIASYEMTTLHNPTSDWCRNQIDAGAVATIGPVSEPYLHSFPAADEFFPLLLTGKLTLAEAYWETTPLVSWRMAIVGDPLYTPFKTNPALKPGDLPAMMQAIFAAHTTTTPATSPAGK